MKSSILVTIMVFLSCPIFSQNLSYNIHGKYEHPVKMEKLVSVELLSDFIPDYPASWIKDYESVEILATTKGLTKKATGKTEALNTEQKSLLKSAELFTKFDISVSHKSPNAVTGIDEVRVIKFSMTVVPNIEAQFEGGAERMKMYVKTNAIDKIPAFSAEYILDGLITFTINEDGFVFGATLTKSTGDPMTDKLLLDTIKNMPKWNPAVDSKGRRVKQEFEFSVSKGGC